MNAIHAILSPNTTTFATDETLLKLQVPHRNLELKAYFHYIQLLG